jgi:nucleoid-associated protein YgaU
LDGAKKGAEGIAGSQAGQGQFPQTYVIQENDSYWRLADRFYGDGTLMAYIEKANPEVKMQPGRKLVIPPPPAVATPAAKPGDPAPSGATGQLQKGELPKEEPPAASGTGFAAKAPGIVGAGPGYRVYHVEKGETFWSIARKFYGDSKKYTRVLEEANPEQKKGLLAGARIKIPDPPAQR